MPLQSLSHSFVCAIRPQGGGIGGDKTHTACELMDIAAGLDSLETHSSARNHSGCSKMLGDMKIENHLRTGARTLDVMIGEL